MFSNLRAEMAKRNIKGKDLAALLNVRSATIYDKMNGHYDFTYKETLAIKNHFFPEYELEYLFNQEEEVKDSAATRSSINDPYPI